MAVQETLVPARKQVTHAHLKIRVLYDSDASRRRGVPDSPRVPELEAGRGTWELVHCS